MQNVKCKMHTQFYGKCTFQLEIKIPSTVKAISIYSSFVLKLDIKYERLPPHHSPPHPVECRYSVNCIQDHKLCCPGGHGGGRGAEPDHRDAAPEGRLEAGHGGPRPGPRQEGGQAFMVPMSQHFPRHGKLFAQNLIKHTIWKSLWLQTTNQPKTSNSSKQF